MTDAFLPVILAGLAYIAYSQKTEDTADRIWKAIAVVSLLVCSIASTIYNIAQ